MAFMLLGTPIFVVILWETIYYLVKLQRFRGEIYLELDTEKIIYNSVLEGKFEIPIKKICDIKFDGESMYIYVDYPVNMRKHKLRSLFRYYVENMECVYQIPVLGNASDMKGFFEKVKKTIVIKDIMGMQFTTKLCEIISIAHS